MSAFNNFASVAVPQTAAAGPGVDVSDMVAEKTFTLPPFGSGTVIIEASADGGVTYAPLLAIAGPRGEPQTSTVKVSCDHLRVRRTTGSGPAVDLDVAAGRGDPFSAVLPTNGIDHGPSVSMFDAFQEKSIIVTGDFTGTVVVSGTALNSAGFNPIQEIQIRGAGVYNLVATYLSMRVESVQLTSGSLDSVSVGATSPFTLPTVVALTAGDMIDIQPPFGQGVVTVSVIPGEAGDMNAVGVTNQAGVANAAARIDHTHAAALPIIPFTGVITGDVGATVSYLADGGLVGAVNQTTPFRRPTGSRQFLALRVTVISDNSVNAVTATLYQNGAPTTMTVTIPAGSAPNTKFTDFAHATFFNDGDDFDLRLDNPGADAGHTVAVSAALEYLA